jgi:endonuclease G
MKKLLTLVAAATLSFGVYAEPSSHCDQMVAYGYPTTDVSSTTALCRMNYFVEHDNTKKVPAYSAELLLKEYSSGKNKRVNAFKADPDVDPAYRADLNDYNKSYDRGHMTPFEDTKYKSAASLQTFYLSNMVPQNLHLNRGLWRAIENQTRKIAAAHENGVFVVTGPVFDNAHIDYIGQNVGVPTRIFKVIIDKEHNQGVAWLVPNIDPKEGDTPDKFKTTIDEVEKATGINFTPKLNNSALIFKHLIGEEFQ